MTHESLKAKIMVMGEQESLMFRLDVMAQALHSILLLHVPMEGSPYCQHCCGMAYEYPCPTIELIQLVFND
jgi:hypothetical protein